MKIAVVEDSNQWAEKIEIIAKEVWKEGCERFHSAEALFHENKYYDVIFMDTELPRVGGIKATGIYKQQYDDSMIFLVTAHLEYSMEGYDTGVDGFLDKDNLEYWMERTFHSVQKKIDNRRRNVCAEFAISGEGKRWLKLRDIIYFQADKGCVQIKTKTGVYITAESLKRLRERLNQDGFVMAHKYYYINMEQVKRIEKNTGQRRDKMVVMSDGTSIPLSRNREDEVRELFWNGKSKAGRHRGGIFYG